MSTRDERRRARRIARIAGKHWLVAGKDIENRVYMAVRVANLIPGLPYPPSDTRPCANCQELVSIDKRLIPLADRAQMIACEVCAAAASGKTHQQLIIDNLNRDSGEEI